MIKNYLIYLCYTNDDFLSEVLFSLLSFYKHNQNSNIQVVIYTDNITFFKKMLPNTICYNEINESKIEFWKGSIKFNHRTKIKVLQDASAKYKGNLMYVDSDTFFKKNCDELFQKIENNEILFDNYEGKLNETKGGIAKKLRSFLNNQNSFSTVSDPEKIYFPDDFEIWNAGIIGFKAEHGNQLQLVLELVDELYAKFPIFVMEQLAFNYYFQKISKPCVTQDFIDHYWYFKEFRLVLNDFFSFHKGKSLDELISKIESINPKKLAQEKIAYKKKSFIEKQIHKLVFFRKWKIIPYTLH